MAVSDQANVIQTELCPCFNSLE